jgi:hypothetical protein
MQSNLTSRDISRIVTGVTREGAVAMFEMYPMALEMEVQRRREVLAGSMGTARGRGPRARRVPDTLRFRHVMAALVTFLG